MPLKHFVVSALLFILMITAGFAQSKKTLDTVLLKTYNSKDSATYYFSFAKKMLRTKADTANYLYFKFYNAAKADKQDSAQYFSDKVIPLLKDLDSLERLRKVYSRSHYIKLHQGRYELAIEYNQKALKIAEKLKDTAMISLHLTDISNVYHDFEDYEKGVAVGKKAYKILATSNNPVPKYLIFANNVIAINFDDWKKPDSALAYHFKNLKYLEKVDDSLRYSFVLNNIGNTLLKQKKYSEAKKYINRALTMDLIKSDNYFLATDYTNLATIAYNQNLNKTAAEYFEKANEYAKKSGSIEKIRDVVQQQALYYKNIGNYKQALELQEKFYVLRDSVFNEERAKKVAEMATKYETEKKERQLAESRTQLVQNALEIEQKNATILGVISFAVILCLLGFMLYNKQKLKNRQLQKEGELNTALARIETQNKLQESGCEFPATCTTI